MAARLSNPVVPATADAHRAEAKAAQSAEYARRIRAALTKIAALDDPTSVGKRLVADDNIWRYRAGTFRILCTLDHDKLVVLVVRLGHRREVYRRTR